MIHSSKPKEPKKKRQCVHPCLIFIIQVSLTSDSTNVLLKAVTKSALLHKKGVCISQTSICSQEQVNIPPLSVLIVSILTFVQTYDFFIVNTGIDKRSSMLRPKHRRQSSAAMRASHRERRSSGQAENANESSIKPEASKPPESIREITDSPASSQGPATNADVDDLTSTMSALKFIPPSVRFGRGGHRGGLARS